VPSLRRWAGHPGRQYAGLDQQAAQSIADRRRFGFGSGPRTRCKAGPPAGCSLQVEPVSLASVFQLWSGGDGAPDKEKAHREMRLFHSPPGSHSG